MTKRKWIQLVDPNGHVVGDETTVDVDYEDVAGLMDNVIKQFGQSHVFRGIGSFELCGFASDAKRLKGEELAASASIHGLGDSGESAIVVQLPRVVAPSSLTALPTMAMHMTLPPLTALDKLEGIKNECLSLPTLVAGAVYHHPLIKAFLAPLGGCTPQGKLYWREDERQVFSMLRDALANSPPRTGTF